MIYQTEFWLTSVAMSSRNDDFQLNENNLFSQAIVQVFTVNTHIFKYWSARMTRKIRAPTWFRLKEQHILWNHHLNMRGISLKALVKISDVDH